ncbi:MAG: sensor histidine kinase KdpD [Acidimicrobiales bacterium]|nr:sensor histidine kinase KdpD [Acidimicrobiales bacterium]MCB9392793.1 sensor histidine kinase KdpD [Acidimicrobiaceae bacterium]
MARGQLRIYLGASPGVGKTFAMLNEGRRRLERGTDVVVAVVETHGRVNTAAQLGDLEVVPRRSFEHRGANFTEMDVDAVLARRPALALVDEFAHTNVPGSRNEKRWQDVEMLLDAGIDVISTLNIQHLDSLNDVVAKITGITQRETVPDAVVRRADQIELVDMSPEALRRRMAHGNIYPAERIDAAMTNFFRPGNLGALRELALLWVADRVEESLSAYVAQHGIADAWETRERVVVGLSGAPGGDALIRRAARIAGRVGGELVGVHVVSDDGLTRDHADVLIAQRALVESLGGRSHEVVGHDRAETLVEFSRTEKATQLVIGATARTRREEWLHGSFVSKVTRLARDVDVHVIGRGGNADRDVADVDRVAGRAVRRGPFGRERAMTIDLRRQLLAWALVIVGLPGLTATFHRLHDEQTPIADDFPTVLLLFLALTVTVAAIGGMMAGTVCAVVGSVLVNWWFVEPRFTLTIAQGRHVVALVVFVAVAMVVGAFVNASARRSSEARRARAEAEALARSATSLATDPNPVPTLLEEIRRTMGLDGVRLVTTGSDRTDTVVAASGGVDVAATTIELRPADDGRARRLELSGRRLSTDDRRVLTTLADQLAIAADTEQLEREAATAERLSEVDAVRTALLRAVSHDLRTPLSTIKALVSGVLDPTVSWSDEQLREALTSVDHETDRLNRLVGNLLDASRLQIGALAVHRRRCATAEIIDTALRSLGPEADDVQWDTTDVATEVTADPTLAERSLANVVSNALRYGAAHGPIRVRAERVGDEVHVRVVDRGPGIPPAVRQQVVAPFQRLGDTNTADGVGLGLAIAQGFLDAMGGRLELDDTPGGGLTVTLVLPAAVTGSDESADADEPVACSTAEEAR